MTIFKCKLRNLSDLIKLVIYSNTKTNIHIIHCKGYYTDAACHRTYFVYYGGGAEYYYTQDPIDGLSEGLYEIEYLKKEINTGNAKYIEVLTPTNYDTSKVYIFIIGVEDVGFE